ncbi:phospho-sugar mutase [Candidatus Izemoplasma sp. B36]|uniref:phospho-sugar mutase n=1 Tax=Candidatus Izemoplasma sp. B36 TaxID=3242468 RepID=UPI003555F860
MMWKDKYEKWINYPKLDSFVKKDLEDKKENELEDMFYTNLSFGTGGMRGILGAGTNRLNIYTIRRANVGLAKYLLKTYKPEQLSRGVVIAHDNRRMSREFAKESAMVLGAFGINSYLFEGLRPTPELSFAVRETNALAGIVVTASHNPPNYNGYKIYDEFGCQYTPRYANEIVSYVNEIDDLFSIKTIDYEELLAKKMLVILGEPMDRAYLDAVKTVAIYPEIKKPLKIVFTPLHGTSGYLGERLLKETGYNVYPVKEQMINDPDFPTVKLPNPEEKSAFELAEKLGRKIKSDLLIATDPDADRLGIGVLHNDNYIYLSGNQTGALMIYYLLSQKSKLNKLPKKGVVFNTVVTSNLGAIIAKSFGMDVISTLTGFKFIGEQARYLENDDREFVFGYEESYGYVVKDFVRDKDSLQAILLIAEAATYYHVEENKTLYDKLIDIYKAYGYYYEGLKNIHLLGKTGSERISRIMDSFRTNNLESLNNIKVIAKEDFQLSKKYINNSVEEITLPKSNVIKYYLEDDSWFVLRPSGTEPKLKIYVGVIGTSVEHAQSKVEEIKNEVNKLVEMVK